MFLSFRFGRTQKSNGYQGFKVEKKEKTFYKFVIQQTKKKSKQPIIASSLQIRNEFEKKMRVDFP